MHVNNACCNEVEFAWNTGLVNEKQLLISCSTIDSVVTSLSILRARPLDLKFKKDTETLRVMDKSCDVCIFIHLGQSAGVTPKKG